MAEPTNLPAVSRGMAESVAAPQKSLGFQDTAVTTEQSVDLKAWRGTYVRIQALGDDYDVCFTGTASDTIATADVALSAASLVAERIKDGNSIDVVVPGKQYFLKYKPVNGTSSTIRVRRA